ncbi:dihydrofolate reductase [Chelatococcus sp. SYSU_G07232]|uniref:Dihydrofolate reductase n=1 Tax=Chelatococcus albus TaxID=3047466 RepID=A0ABT7AGU8_9HYPH|nr:dihydrofolate reductase [Chelatococcus sp. SYSU_G07232]MDJ1158578.1 dihydrofolate reductase [Chelatococcus sp. SYSU_G07232]
MSTPAPSTIPLVVIAAIADNGVIGRDNRLLWRLRTDLRRFRTLTLGKPVLMGRKTFLSIGKPLPGRETIVLTREPAFTADGVTVVHSLEEAAARGRSIAARLGADAVMVAGGADLYAQALPLAERLHLTLVHTAPEGDAFFPAFDRQAFRETMREEHPAGPDDDHAFTFVDYERRR